MKSLVTILLAFVGLLPRLDLSVSSPLAFSYYRSITVDHTKVPSTQTDFPVLVAGTYTDLKTTGNGGHVQNASGYDVGFYTNSDCSTGKMKWETELHTATTGVVVYWVKVASLSSSADTVFYLCYGDSGISSDQSDKTNVWDSNFKGVWHLPNGSSLSANDSTSNANNLTLTNAPTATAGQMDGGANFVAPNVRLEKATNFGIGNTSLTLQGWAKRINTEHGAFIKLGSASDGFAIGVGDGSVFESNGNYLLGLYEAVRWLQSSQTNVGTNFFAFTLVISGTGKPTIYYNASSVFSDSGTNGIAPSAEFYVGGYTVINRYYTGDLDEVRVSSTNRSADWITVDYNNQSSPSTFYTVGSEQSAAGGATSFVPGIINVPIIIRKRHVVIDLPFVPYKRAA